MKKNHSICLGLLAFCVLASASLRAEEIPWKKPLPFQTATIDYTVSGSMTGKKTIYVRDFGRSTAEYSVMTMKMMGMTQRQQEVVITTPDWVYAADLTQGTGTRQINPRKCLDEAYRSLPENDRNKAANNAQAMGVRFVDGMGGRLERNVTIILGFPCDRISVMGTTAYTITGSHLPLRVEGEGMGMKISQVANSLIPGSAPEAKFALPQGIRFVNDPETDRLIREQARSFLKDLVAGRNPGTAHQDGFPAHDQGQDSQKPQTQTSTGQTTSGQSGTDQAGTGQATDQATGQKAGDAGAGQETGDPDVDPVREGVQIILKSLFD